MIRSSRHSLLEANKEKLMGINEFINSYREATNFFIDALWESNVENYKAKFEVPKFISTTTLNFGTKLSARALKCAATQELVAWLKPLWIKKDDANT